MQAFADADLRTMRSRIHAIRLIPGQETRVDLLQGLLELNLGIPGDAVRELNRAAASPEFRDTALPLLGEALHRAGYHAEAVRVLTELLAKDESQKTAFADTSDAELRCRLGQVALELDRPELARGWFQASLAIDPQHQDAQRSLRQLVAMPSAR